MYMAFRSFLYSAWQATRAHRNHHVVKQKYRTSSCMILYYCYWDSNNQMFLFFSHSHTVQPDKENSGKKQWERNLEQYWGKNHESEKTDDQ